MHAAAVQLCLVGNGREMNIKFKKLTYKKSNYQEALEALGKCIRFMAGGMKTVVDGKISFFI